MVKGKIGDTVYLIETRLYVRKATIINIIDGVYVIKFDNGGGIRVSPNRLFNSEEEAKLLIEHYKWNDSKKK